jgi:hypothetical protein
MPKPSEKLGISFRIKNRWGCLTMMIDLRKEMNERISGAEVQDVHIIATGEQGRGMSYNWLPQEYKAVQTDDMYKLAPICVLGDSVNGIKPCEYCRPERLQDDRWVLRCDKKYYDWRNLPCQKREAEKKERKS